MGGTSYWRYVEKRLPHKRRAISITLSLIAGVANPGHDTNALDTDKISHHESTENSSVVDDKITQSALVTKSSVKSRLKVFQLEELYRKKGKHQQSESCSARSPLKRTDSIHHFEPSNADPSAAITLKNANPTISDNSSLAASLLDPMLPISVEGKNSDETGNHLGHNQVDETGKQLIENHLILDNSDSKKQNLAHPKELNVNASPNQSREVLDDLVMINMNREFLLKIIQDPEAKAEGVNSDVGKPQSKEYFRSKSMPSIAADYRMDGILKLNQAMSETVDTSSSSSVHHRKTKHFKDIKHSKNEKHRITMDAVLHKVPHGHEFPNNLKSHSMSRDDKESSISSKKQQSIASHE
ncbi:hypothetical protein GH714_014095 [Hevea brasiliensis]|uniref:DUF3741 domain-containing protein n=1 Tax=Hevea brasiliensis TaxID=3981 RepID=A0A6A6LU46_HEVBR|nr:hypothetical protein GH714_014095 [Hevea brasiliensis]